MTYYIIHPRGNVNIISVIGLEDPKDIRDYQRANMQEYLDETTANKQCELFASTYNKIIEWD